MYPSMYLLANVSPGLHRRWELTEHELIILLVVCVAAEHARCALADAGRSRGRTPLPGSAAVSASHASEERS